MSVALSLCCLFDPDLFAKSSAYKQGLQHYARGEFKEAVGQLQKALPRSRSNEERATIHKFLGMSLYTLGRLPEAEQSFSQCLRIDRSCTVKSAEALDESVVPFFNSIRDQLTRSDAKPPTKIRILSNAKSGEVLLDGIIAGSLGEVLNTESGIVDIEIRSPAYRPRRLKLTVQEGRENTYRIDLDELPAPARSGDSLASRHKSAKPKARTAANGKVKRDSSPPSRSESAMDTPSAAELRERDRPHRKIERTEKEAIAAKNSKIPPVLPKESTIDGEKKGRERNEMPPDTADKHEEENPLRSSGEFESKTLAAPPPESRPGPIPLSTLHFLPFGLGQFKNGDVVLGLTLAAVHSFAIYGLIDTEEQIQKALDNLASAQSEAQNDPNITPEVLATFQKDVTSFVKKREDEQASYAAALAGSYIVGVLHAVIMRPESPQVSTSSSATATYPQWVISASPSSEYRLTVRWRLP